VACRGPADRVFRLSPPRRFQTLNSLLEKTPAELRQAFAADGLEGYRAGQVLRWVYGRGLRDFEDMSNLSGEMRKQLAGEWSTRALELDTEVCSSDGTRKLVLKTADGARIESVIIPEQERRTLCVSSQIGCSLDCSFCATGRMGLGRNLRAEEIVDQVLYGSQRLREEGERLTHLVFMGMGEPLLNLANLVQAIRILTDPDAGAFSWRRVTVSTAGVVPKMQALGEAVRTRLAVSLHATTDEVRDVLVPLNRRFPLAELLDACRRYPVARRDRISFEYTLIRDVNDSAADARRLVKLVHGIPAKINLIPLNEHPGTSYRRPDDETVERFASLLAASRAPVSVRRSRGDDVFAACGQLANLTERRPAESREDSRPDVRYTHQA
jgi:23S rRNA (adenine2503-C2)-methyltransferase